MGAPQTREQALTARIVDYLATRFLRAGATDRIRTALGDGLTRGLDLSASADSLAHRVTVSLLRDHGASGRRGLSALLIAEGEGTQDEGLAAQGQHLAEAVTALPWTPLAKSDAGQNLEIPEALASLREAVQGSADALHLSVDAWTRVTRHVPRTFEEAHLVRIAQALARPEVDERFVALTLRVDQRVDGQAVGAERWSAEQAEYHRVIDALDEDDSRDFILVGAPGCGKSTLLHRLAWEAARRGLSQPDHPVPLWVTLSEHRIEANDTRLDPQAWLEKRWRTQYPAPMPSLTDALRTGHVWLLLDGLNEMPRRPDESLNQRIAEWGSWLQAMHRHHPRRHRVVVACRTRDLTASLGGPDRKVALLEIQRMTEDQVNRFGREYAPPSLDWPALFAQLQEDRKLLAQYANPFSLKLLLGLVHRQGQIPESRAALFTAHVREALLTEHERPGSSVHRWLTERDGFQLVHQRWRSPTDLPEEGELIPRLARLAFELQDSSPRGDQAHVKADVFEVQQMVPWAEDLEAVWAAGADLNLLTPDRMEFQFQHQLLQEYFAARWLAQHPKPRKTQWTWPSEDEDLAKVRARLSEDEPLPGPPVTGWEETTVMAAEMADATFVADLADNNLPLAARAAVQPLAQVDDALKADVRNRLFVVTQDAATDLRVRIQAGEALGLIGHPEFREVRGAEEYRCLVPPMVKIPGGTFRMGSNDGHPNERPEHDAEVKTFWAGKYPVTRAEYRCFMKAGGYEDPRWWPGEAAQAWFRGEGTAESNRKRLRELRTYYQQDPSRIDNNSSLTPVGKKVRRSWVRATDLDFEAALEKWHPAGKLTEPYNWNDERFQIDTHPVVGICWHEAQAYCTWLTAQLQHPFHLPTEIEWERLARGIDGRTYPWTDNPQPHPANTYESHIRKTTPVGVFPDGRSPDGILDAAGNTWEWTTSSKTSSHQKDASQDTGNLIVRGGSWGSPVDLARCAFRYWYPPDRRSGYLGFRMLSPSPVP